MLINIQAVSCDLADLLLFRHSRVEQSDVIELIKANDRTSVSDEVDIDNSS